MSARSTISATGPLGTPPGNRVRRGPALTRVALIGDRDDDVLAHRAIPLALGSARDALGLTLEWTWVGTDTVGDARRLVDFDGLWCVPASPYRDMDGALAAIRYARETRRPFLGTCGGFQHAVIEFARHVAGIADAEHAETAPGAATLLVAPLACALVEKTDEVLLVPGSRVHAVCGRDALTEGFHCSFGLNPVFEPALEAAGMRIAARGPEGEPRAVELPDHPFFVATLFQPERAALRGQCHPIVRAFAEAAAGHGRRNE